MNNGLKKIAGIAIAAIFALGMSSCSSGSSSSTDDPVLPPAPAKETVATPVFSVASGEVNSGTSVEINCETEYAMIYYTMDGSNPTTSSTQYTDAISINEDVSIKAIAVKAGMNDSDVASASYTVNSSPYAKCVVGDFILKDGTVFSRDDDPEYDTVAAVIVRAAGNGKPALGVGIKQREKIEWCKQGAAGDKTNIAELRGDKTSGYRDGSDGWEKLKSACPDAQEHPENYPVWDFILNYAKYNGLKGDLANGWYLPTLAELYTIYQNSGIVNTSLKNAGGNMFIFGYYWSCCQSTDPDSHMAGTLDFNFGTVFIEPKSMNFRCCSVRAFD
ncbi:MAG: chitobiase/beta-hexosaminidase C-terminal domain-containing protein [Treponema sp.]|uniref:chitobiase/beta-hexosaminidase C-terminal domain-containing protein n=1 Tax=Treponema sp. TaxID=166 RepID=UPI00298DA454|nr:chitobiase/beta-hexosaminidase C-terminal domain-containing protein [Treponema sp.]MCQ2601641.1 chitobiase/beta-hexosaminidase C-terminal domain-containing protein [Treponema sp.]